MPVTDEQPTATSTGPDALVGASTRRFRIGGWVLTLGWLCLFVSLVTLGERQGSYAHLEDGLRAGEIDEVTMVSVLSPDSRGYARVEVRWRDGLVVRTTMLTSASDERAAAKARRDGAAQPVIVGTVEDHLTALDPDVRLVPGERRGPS